MSDSVRRSDFTGESVKEMQEQQRNRYAQRLRTKLALLRTAYQTQGKYVTWLRNDEAVDLTYLAAEEAMLVRLYQRLRKTEVAVSKTLERRRSL